MNSIRVRAVCLVLGLAALGFSAGCVSFRHWHGEGPEINPTVTGRPNFGGGGTSYSVALEVHVVQQSPKVEEGHTWTVHVWTSTSNSNLVSPSQLDAILSHPWQAARPDLSADNKDVYANLLQLGVPSNQRYYIVVVQAIEMTSDEFPEVFQETTHVKAFDNGKDVTEPVEIPEYGDYAPKDARGQALTPQAHGTGPHPVNSKLLGRPKFDRTGGGVYFDDLHKLSIYGEKAKGSTVTATVWGSYADDGNRLKMPDDLKSYRLAKPISDSNPGDQFAIVFDENNELSPPSTVPAGKWYCMLVELIESDGSPLPVDTEYLANWFRPTLED